MNKAEHLLTCLIEECAEVQKAATKALRFGLTDGSPNRTTTNAKDIAQELLEVVAITELLEENGIIERPKAISAIEQKKAKIHTYMDYAAHTGTLTD